MRIFCILIIMITGEHWIIPVKKYDILDLESLNFYHMSKVFNVCH